MLQLRTSQLVPVTLLRLPASLGVRARFPWKQHGMCVGFDFKMAARMEAALEPTGELAHMRCVPLLQLAVRLLVDSPVTRHHAAGRHAAACRVGRCCQCDAAVLDSRRWSRLMLPRILRI